jgi:hypothetical protein
MIDPLFPTGSSANHLQCLCCCLYSFYNYIVKYKSIFSDFRNILLILMISDGGEERQEVSINCSFLVHKLSAFTNYTFYVRAYSSKSASDQSKRTKCQTGEGGKFSAKL